jgi:RHS repeat-associated protein
VVLQLGGPGEAAKPARSDLTVTAVGNAPAQLPAGGVLRTRITVANRGSRAARRSITRLYLSKDKRKSRSDVRLAGRLTTATLKPHRKSTKRASVRVPVTIALAKYRLLACADDRGAVRERNERNNCRAASRTTRITTGPGAGNGNGNGNGNGGPGAGGDTTPPDTEITAGPSGTIKSNRATFEFRASEGGAGFECRVDDAAFAPCSSPHTRTRVRLGFHAFEVRAVDGAGNRDASPARREWSVGAEPPVAGPSDAPASSPVESATPIPLNQVTLVDESTRFLYSGSDPIQVGVANGAVETAQASVVRGRVVNRLGGPVAGARVTVPGMPELGRTATRTDGGFDIAVNGGGDVTLEFEREGFISAQRTVRVPANDYAEADDVVLIPFDDAVTEIELGSTRTQFARGSRVADADGARRATLIFPPGLGAQMVLPDGSGQGLDTMRVRATEYTIGSTGPEAMPGDLPPSSAYTYAVEFTADEAVEAGAEGVRFDKPVISYTDNFLGFDAGTKVPAGAYDRDLGAWVADPDGVVIEIVSEQGGRAQIDADGDGAPDGDAALAALEVTQGELETLGEVYAPGDTLWRVPVTHFSPRDFNWPYDAPGGARGPDVPGADGDEDPDDPCKRGGSIVYCEDRALGEELPIAGTQFGLVYRSDRVPGRSSAVRIPLSGSSLPPGLLRIELTISVAGRTFKHDFDPAPNLAHEFVWDGRDGYGREVFGAQPATIAVDYMYTAVFRGPAELESSFAAFGGPPIGRSGRIEARIGTTSKVTVLGPGWAGRDTGGWTLSAHHSYDAGGRLLWRGDGSRQSAEAQPYDIVSVLLGPAADGPSKPETEFHGAGEFGKITTGPDGSLYVAHGDDVRRLAPGGEFTIVAGGGDTGAGSDGGLATDAQLGGVEAVAVATDGTFYLADWRADCVRRVSPDGIIDTAAGICLYGDDQRHGMGTTPYDPAEPGGPATAESLDRPVDVELGPDGSLYILERGNTSSVARLSPDGILTRVAGTGEDGFSADGGQAQDSALRFPTDIAVAGDGTLYIVESGSARIRQVRPDGAIDTLDVATGAPGSCATLSSLTSLALLSDGSIVAGGAFCTWRISPAHALETLLRGYVPPDFTGGDGGPLAKAHAQSPVGLAEGRDGSILFVERHTHKVRRIHPALPGRSLGDLEIPSPAGDEVYVVDRAGRHARTVDALTGATKLTFGYDSGRLTTVTDADGNATTIHRDAAGLPDSIEAPGGQLTELSTDANGWLSSVTNPAGETVTLTSAPNGLLTSLQKPGGGLSTFTFDARGQLTRDEGPDGVVTTLSETRTGDKRTVAATSAEGRAAFYELEDLPDGSKRRTTTDPNGAKTVTTAFPDGTERRVTPDGTVIRTALGPDPRFGMQVPLVTRRETETPSGKKSVVTATHSAELDDPLAPLTMRTSEAQLTRDGHTTIIEYDRDAPGGRTLTTTSPVGRVTAQVLDPRGRLRRTLAAGRDPQEIEYDSHGRIARLQQGAQLQQNDYDAQNRLIARTDALGARLEYGRDAAGRVTEERYPGGRVYAYGYDADGNRTSMTTPDGRVHLFTSTDGGGESTIQPAGVPQPYERQHNNDLQQTRFATPSGAARTSVFSTNGELASSNTPDASRTFGYTAGTNFLASMTRTPVGGGAPSTVSFESDGVLGKRVSFSGAAEGSFAYGSSNGHLLQSVTLTSGTDDPISTAFAYDGDALPVAVGPFSFARAGPQGDVSQISSSVLDLDFTYDSHGRLAQRAETVNAVVGYGLTLVRDAGGRPVQKQERVPDGAGGTTTRTFDYEYDAVGQLTQVKRDGTVVEHYLYDGDGNRTSRQLGAAPAEPVSYDGQDSVASAGAVPYSFDVDGYLTARGLDSFVYGRSGELLSATVGPTTVTYAYDALGRRVRRTDPAGSTTYLYGNPAQPFELSATRTAGVLTFLYYDEQSHLFAFRRGSSLLYVGSDAAGTPRVVMDDMGNVVDSIERDAFGNVVTESAPAFDLPLGFAGGIPDRVTGLVRFGLRDYDPATGRFTARDPALFDGSPKNLYAYAGSAPVEARDPSGLVFEVSGSFYYGGGGGGSVFINDEGRPGYCSEVGVGYGGGLTFGTGGADKSGSTDFIEGSINVAGIGLTGSLERAVGLPDGCASTGTLSGNIGPFGFSESTTGQREITASMEEGDYTKEVFEAGVKAEVKEGRRTCTVY